MIRIVNKGNSEQMAAVALQQQKGPNSKCLTVYCGRGTPVGNPFIMSHISPRDDVCDRYEKWFEIQLERKDNPEFHEYLAAIAIADAVGDVHLVCWCKPLRCHCDTIKNYLENESET